jgi:PAS domain S-box-containing protein
MDRSQDPDPRPRSSAPELQRRAEEAERRVALLEGLLQASPEVTLLCERDGRCIFANQAAAEAAGLKAAAMAGRPSSELGHLSNLVERFEAQSQPVFSSGQTLRGDARLATEAGHRDYEYVVSPVFAPDGSVRAAVVSARDVTTQRHTDREREELLIAAQSEAAKLDTVVSALPEALAVYDVTGEIVRMNAAAQQLLGYTPAVYNLPIAERLRRLRVERPDGSSPSLDQIPSIRALRGESVYGDLLKLWTADAREVWVLWSAAPVRDTTGKQLGAVIVLNDVTHLRDSVRRQADLMRAIAHDLRNPVAVILGHAQVLLSLLDRAGEAGPARRSAEAILRTARHVNVMVQELVDSVRIESGQLRLDLRAIDLREFVPDIVAHLPEVGWSERVRVVYPDGVPPVRADPDRLERILTNLLTNACKYSPGGSKVTVALAHRDGEVVVSVADQGYGIPRHELPRVFDRFFRSSLTSDLYEGLGLGLYIVKGLVEAHGGQVWVESTPGRGSTFSFTLLVA